MEFYFSRKLTILYDTSFQHNYYYFPAAILTLVSPPALSPSNNSTQSVRTVGCREGRQSGHIDILKYYGNTLADRDTHIALIYQSILKLEIILDITCQGRQSREPKFNKHARLASSFPFQWATNRAIVSVNVYYRIEMRR